MLENSIALIPHFGYQNPEATSSKAIWLKYMSIKTKLSIQHSRNGKEKKILQYKIDGWNEQTNTAFEFHGCVYHGCPKCFSINSIK